MLVVSLDRPFGSRSRLGAFLARTDHLSLDGQRRQEQDESKDRFRGYSHVGSSLYREKEEVRSTPSIPSSSGGGSDAAVSPVLFLTRFEIVSNLLIPTVRYFSAAR